MLEAKEKGEVGGANKHFPTHFAPLQLPIIGKFMCHCQRDAAGPRASVAFQMFFSQLSLRGKGMPLSRSDLFRQPSGKRKGFSNTLSRNNLFPRQARITPEERLNWNALKLQVTSLYINLCIVVRCGCNIMRASMCSGRSVHPKLATCNQTHRQHPTSAFISTLHIA